MIKLINANTGGDMWVHESRLDEYLAAGHKIAPPPGPVHPTAKPVKPATKSAKK